jgi:hypothetical protein
MEFGMFHEFPSLPGRSDTEAFDEGMAQVDAAERHGLDAMWLAEIHFAPERTHLSAPLPIAAAIAARTSRMKIGIAVQVLPLCHPLRLRRGGRDGGPAEPRQADLRRRAQRRRQHLRRLSGAL